MSIYQKELGKSLEKACGIKGSQALLEIEEYTERKLIGLKYFPDGATSEYWKMVNEWDNTVANIWREIPGSLTVGEQVKKICEDTYDVDEELFLDNDKIDPVTRAAVIFSAINTINSLFLDEYLLNKLDVNESDDALNEVSRKKTIIMMAIVLIMGTTDDVRKIFYLLMDTPALMLGKKTAACTILTKDYEDRFTDDFRDTLGTLSRTGNFIIDVVYNDSTRDFILAL